jgi:type VI secretion system secreted protein VgrG
MGTYTQKKRLLSVKTPLGNDVLLLVGLLGRESVSQLFHFTLDLLSPNEKAEQVDFSKVLGQKICVELRVDGESDTKRYFHGICSRVAQGRTDEHFTEFTMEMVPQLWLFNWRSQSRIFQQMSVPDILKKVLTGVDVDWRLSGKYERRNHYVQYRESDLRFASRLMEEEGIFYFFKHEEGKHTMVVADSPQGHPALAPSDVRFDKAVGGTRDDQRVRGWQKCQELRAGKCTLWDYSFELPKKHLEATATTQQDVTVGRGTHELKVGGNNSLELYDYPGEYAKRFDGIDKSGSEQPAELNKIFQDNKRTVDIRMQQEAVGSLLIDGNGDCDHFAAGHKFSLSGNEDADGEYVLTSVSHLAKETGYRSGETVNWTYENTFKCIPSALPYRPARITAKPVVAGTQTAVVVGPAGEEIFTDKYGRVKIQFHWDREGRNDSDSSCWVRVGTPLAGNQWGMVHIPRIGQEVIVAFLEGDPDRPLIVGSVYNADQMPPYSLPDNKTQSGIKSRSTLSGASENFNELRFEDKKGEEQVYFHAEKDFSQVVENNFQQKIGFDKKDPGTQTTEVYGDRTTTVETGHDKTQIKKGNREVLLDKGNDTLTLKMGKRTVLLEQGDSELTIKKGDRNVVLEMGNDQLQLKMGNSTTKLDVGKSQTEAMQSIELKVGQSSIKVDQTGVTIKGLVIKIEGQIMTDIKGVMTQIQGSAMLKAGGGIVMIG